MTIFSEIMDEFGISRSDLSRIVAAGPGRYKIYEIPKKGGGLRTIAQPSREIKELQRFASRRILSRLPVHHAAHAYVKGRNIDTNAHVHRTGQCILKLDFRSFFPSIRVVDWQSLAKKHPKILDNDDDVTLLGRIFFYSGSNRSSAPRILSIGAPSSPLLSNIIMYDLDVFLSEVADEVGVRYTRYADDITVSAENINDAKNFEQIARKYISRLNSPRLAFNDEKRGIYIKGQRQMVTGLIITPDSKVSIGRDRKRMISSLIHKFTIGIISLEDLGYLKGMLGFAIANEEDFVSRMRFKYGDGALNRILSYKVPRKKISLNK